MSAVPPDDRRRGTERPIGDEPPFDTAQSADPTSMRTRSRAAAAATIAVLVLVVLAVVLIVLL
jgi:hypothetical protein